MRSRILSFILFAALAAAPCLAVESPVAIGSVATTDGVSVSLAVTPAGTIVISTSSNPLFVDKTFAVTLAGYLGRVGSEMQALQARTLLGRDSVSLARLPYTQDLARSQEGFAFGFDIDASGKDKVLFRIVPTLGAAPLLFNADGVARLGELATKASEYVDAIRAQDSYLAVMAGRLASVEGSSK